MAIDFGDIAAVLGGAAFGALSPSAGDAFSGAVQDWKQSKIDAENRKRTEELQAREDAKWARQQEEWKRGKIREEERQVDRRYILEERAEDELEEDRDEEERERIKGTDQQIRTSTTSHPKWEEFLTIDPGAAGRMELDPVAASKTFAQWLNASNNQKMQQTAIDAENQRWDAALQGMLGTEEGQRFLVENPHLAPLGAKALVQEFNKRLKSGAGKGAPTPDEKLKRKQEYVKQTGAIDEKIRELKDEYKEEILATQTDEALAQVKEVYGAQLQNLQEQRSLLDERWKAFTEGEKVDWEGVGDSMKRPANTDEEKLLEQARADAGL